MTGPETTLDHTASARTMPTVPEDRPAPKAPTKGGPSSIGACDACRIKKVRCLANESSLSSKCQRCARAKRECVYTTHSKTRRRKRTDTRVKELEEKVRGLSMLLEHGKGSSITPSAERDIGSVPEEEDSRRSTSNEQASLTPEETGELSWKKMVPASYDEDAGQVVHDWGKLSTISGADPVVPDVVDRGLLSMGRATALFNRYNDLLMPQYPAFPIDCTAAELRKDRPILFLAVLAASVEASDPILSLKLDQEIQELYAKKVAVQGRKSLELIQALCITILWTYPPQKFQELKFHQQIHMAATMALDIGLGKRSRAPKYLNLDPADIGSDPAHITLAKTRSSETRTLEGRRALLACYINCTSVSMSLRLPNMLRFTTWMSECVEVLETSPDAAPLDKRFAAWVKLQHIVEDCFMSLGLDNPDEAVSLDEDRAQLALRGAEKQLSAWKKQAAAVPGLMNDFLDLSYHTNNIYLHEIALHPDHDAEDFKPPFAIRVKARSRRKLTSPYINAIMVCVNSSQSLLEVFLAMDVDVVRVSPTLVFVRVTYALVVLMKLSMSASAPSSELGQYLDSDDCKVPYFAERVVAFMDAVAHIEDEKKHILAFKFLHILNNLKKWFEKQTLPLDAKNGQQFQTDVNQDWDPLTTWNGNSDPPSSTAAMSSNYRAPTQNKDLSQYSSTSSVEGNYLVDSATSLISRAYDDGVTQSRPAVSFPNGAQPLPNFQASDHSFMPSSNSAPFDFPMDVDPNLFPQLATSQLHESSGGEFMLHGGNWMGSTDMTTDFDWSHWFVQ
ncbi:hypothetical protein N7G274_010619 [Stereocaulon virgatum]|uniref:Zn(2)-C6 fungal-type domain-containing protein n=1 Tax=Stereocaulon virgatum TaxID=373712 RepID=A0ABR3ZU94_9LECA